MDDLKIVFYIVVAIIWVVYNNYKKVAEAAKKRDISKPYEETIPENWPKEVSLPTPPPAPKPQSYQKHDTKTIRPVKVPAPPTLRKPETLKRDPIRKERMSANYKFQQSASPVNEGGNLQPSKLVHFEDALIERAPSNRFAEEIRNADFRQGIILAEVLQRPYI